MVPVKRKELAKIQDKDEDEERKMRRKMQKAQSKRRIAEKRKIDQYGECIAGLITKTFKVKSSLHPSLPSRPKNKNKSTGDLLEGITLGSNQQPTTSKSPAPFAFSQRNSYSEDKLVVIESEAKDDNKRHAAKVAEEVAAMILSVPEYLLMQTKTDFTTIEKEVTEENAAHIARIEADKKKQESEWSIRVTIDTNTWNEFMTFDPAHRNMAGESDHYEEIQESIDRPQISPGYFNEEGDRLSTTFKTIMMPTPCFHIKSSPHAYPLPRVFGSSIQ
ncbi:hypothetical protein OUZ56_029165 [Daphnia magna]|uniref:Uncharacterized protein n=1 Tax=Daphnia magna TaxID=35525 RepID=A0ABR0B626_9CRUS|nr:hypothetical protein OUZ56_029165 [Daphnia magna]